MRFCLDLCSGKGWFSEPFREAGYDVLRIDNDLRFEDVPGTEIDDALAFLRDYDRDVPDVILASPPCECFSVASIGAHWTGGKGAYQPKDKKTEDALDFVKRLHAMLTTWDWEENGNIKAWVMENPRGVLRKVFLPLPTATVSLCRYGDDRMKPTDLWGRLPARFVPKMCHNGAKDHQEARRGAKTGTQGRKDPADRASMYYLGKALVESMRP